nr:hypothetical protein GCM10017611_84520 [Rhodococcus wratislaviensis]
MRRQDVPQSVERRIDVEFGACGRGDVCDEPGTLLAVVDDHHRLLHHVGRVECGFDLAEFDPETADLHLEVAASHEHEPAVGTLADEVTGPVHAGTGPLERVRHES